MAGLGWGHFWVEVVPRSAGKWPAPSPSAWQLREVPNGSSLSLAATPSRAGSGTEKTRGSAKDSLAAVCLGQQLTWPLRRAWRALERVSTLQNLSRVFSVTRGRVLSAAFRRKSIPSPKARLSCQRYARHLLLSSSQDERDGRQMEDVPPDGELEG